MSMGSRKKKKEQYGGWGDSGSEALKAALGYETVPVSPSIWGIDKPIPPEYHNSIKPEPDNHDDVRIICPECGRDMELIKLTMSPASGMEKREYKCNNCGHKREIEIPIGESNTSDDDNWDIPDEVELSSDWSNLAQRDIYSDISKAIQAMFAAGNIPSTSAALGILSGLHDGVKPMEPVIQKTTNADKEIERIKTILESGVERLANFLIETNIDIDTLEGYYVTTDGMEFHVDHTEIFTEDDAFNKALEHEIDWLNQEADNETNS